MTKTRVIAALIMAPAAICAILLLPTQWLAALAALVFLIGLWEWLKLAGVGDSLARTVLLLLNLLLMVLLVWASRMPAGYSPALLQLTTVVGAAWWVIALLWLRFFNFGAQHEGLSRPLKMVAGSLAIVPAWAAACLIHSNNFDANGDGHPHMWLLTSLALVWAADSGAYFAGRQFGKRKLAPRISPNKTIEGLLGGMVAGLLVALGFGLIAGVSIAQIPALLLVAALSVLASVLGDLFESLLKRHAGAKDSGTIIPGHGGVLDRIDGVLAALPIYALGKEILGF